MRPPQVLRGAKEGTHREARVLGEIPPRHAGPAASDLPEEVIEQERRNRLGVPGQYVVHYTRAQTAFEYILPERRLRLSSFDQVDDPRENKDWVALASHVGQPRTAASLDQFAEELARPKQLELSDAIARANAARARGTKLLCLTTEPTERSQTEDFERAYARPRMWEQYGDNHRGACLVFDRVTLHEELMPQLRAQGVAWQSVVSYDNAALLEAVATAGFLQIRGGLELTDDLLKFAIPEHIAEHSKALLFTKMEDYDDERELRYAVYDGEAAQHMWVDFASSLHAVVVGEAFPDEALAAARTMATEAGAVLRRMMWGPYGPLPMPVDE